MSKETAEEKLLKMMQKTPSNPGASSGSSRSSKKSFVFSIRFLNQILFVGIVLCILGLVYEVHEGKTLLGKEVNFSDDAKTSAALADIALPSSRNAGYYLEKINSRNIFRPYEAPSAKAGGAQSLAKRLSKYKLVGVAWLDLPETASIMIEDTANGATYFLKQGEQLEGVTVKTIYTDRAVFSYKNEETTIKL